MRLLLLTTLGVALLTLPGQPGSAGLSAQSPSLPGLMAQAAADGRVRVIVGHRRSVVPERQLAGQAAIDAQRAGIAQTTQAILASLPALSVADVKAFETLPFFAAEVDAAGLAALAASPLVSSIEEDIAVPPVLSQSGPLVQATDAWTAGYAGAGWTVAILDTGVDGTHPALSGKVVAEACYSSTTSGAASLCPGGASSSTSPGSGLHCPTSVSGCDHGTHVAGIAAGDAAGVRGIARSANVIAIQIFSQFSTGCTGGATACLRSFTSDQIRGMERVYALRDTFNIASINMSLGGGRFFSNCDSSSAAQKAAVDTLRAVGIATVIASGNDGYGDSMSSPGCISTAVSVGSTTKSDAVSSFSNTASFLSLLAPGSSIVASVPNGGTGTKSGTSMATPHVAGAWAILKQFKPTATVAEVLAILRATGRPIVDSLNGLTFPRIQIKAALDAPPIAFGKSGPASGTTGLGSSVTLTWSASAWASGQEYCVDTLNNSQCDGAWTPAGAGTTATVGNLANGTTYFWQVRASNSSGTTLADGGAWWSFTPGQLGNPAMALDVPTSGASVGSIFTLGGWAVDRAAASGAGVDYVHAYAYPIAAYNGGVTGGAIFLRQINVSNPRPDIAAALGSQFTNCGFSGSVSTLSPGVYRIYVYAHSTVTGTFNNYSAPVDITVGTSASDPVMYIDQPQSGTVLSASQPLTVAGWSLDRGATSGSGIFDVHVQAFPVLPGPPFFVWSTSSQAGSLGVARPDIANVYGSQFANAGYNMTVPAGRLPAGTYDLYVFSFCNLAGAGQPCQARTVRVTVQ